MGWTPPTEDEFNGWFTPDDVLEGQGHRAEGLTRKRELIEQLRGGMVLPVARTGQPDPRKTVLESFVPISRELWAEFSDEGNSLFWERGLAVITVFFGDGSGYGGYSHTFRFFDVRFDPRSFSGRPISAPEPPVQAAPSLTAQATADPQRAEPRTADLSTADAERFCRAILGGWPDATQDFAHEKALLFFPDNRVPRDWFRSILRSIRGHKNPGRQPKTRE